MSKNLTPYDRNEVAQPTGWMPDGDDDRYGRVDFDDDSGFTIVPGLRVLPLTQVEAIMHEAEEEEWVLDLNTNVPLHIVVAGVHVLTVYEDGSVTHA